MGYKNRRCKMYDKSKTSAKGRYGEQIVDKMLLDMGWEVSKEVDGQHIIDRIITNTHGYKYGLDVKTKPRLKYYPATGFDLEDYEAYKQFGKNNKLSIMIIFVDEDLGSIYGNYLDVIEKECNGYPKYFSDRHGKQQIIFPISKMVTIRKLTPEEITTLKILKSYYDMYSEAK